jgi:hypothetical protein
MTCGVPDIANKRIGQESLTTSLIKSLTKTLTTERSGK